MQHGKRKLTAFCVSAAAALLYTCIPALADGQTGFAVCSDYLNIRAEASSEGEVIGKLYNNGACEVLEDVGDGWYHIRSGNVEGYAAAEYIATGDEASSIASSAGYTTAEVGAWALNVHADRDESSEVIGTVYENCSYEVVDSTGDWIKLVTDDGTYGWVSADYVYTSTEYGQAETLEEEQARLDEQWLAYLAEQEAASYDNSWSDGSESYDDGSWTDDGSGADTYTDTYSGDTYSDDTYDDGSGWTADTSSGTDYTDTSSDTSYTDTSSGTDYTDTSSSDTSSADTSSASTASASSIGQAAANYACQFVGNPYVYGGTSLTNGADCSGFVMSVYAHFGISLPHNAAAQSAYGTAVSTSSLAAGDLVFYSDGGGISHVAIYIGGGSIVHAANSSSGICYGSLGSPVACRRVG